MEHKWRRERDWNPRYGFPNIGFQVEAHAGVSEAGARSRNPERSDGTSVEHRWRRERDSNPRYGFPYIGFQDRLFQPLTHPSAVGTGLITKS